MGERKMKVVDVARATDLHRNTISLLYKEEAKQVDFETLNRLCKLFNCKIPDLLEYIPDPTKKAFGRK